MLRVLNRVPPGRPGSVLDIVMLTAGTPIISQDSDLRPEFSGNVQTG